jgi:hypothetical protein
VFYQRLLASDPIEAAEQADIFLKEDRLDDFLDDVAVPGLMLANYDYMRGVLSTERLTVIANSFSETLDEIWPEDDSAAQKDVPVLLISAHGPLNFAATLAFSALLKTRGVSHQMLPEEVITPGKFPEIDMTNVGFVCLCYLTAPSEAKHSYVLRRISPLVKEARVISVAWSGSADRVQVQSPANAVSLLPTTDTKPEESKVTTEPTLVDATQM